MRTKEEKTGNPKQRHTWGNFGIDPLERADSLHHGNARMHSPSTPLSRKKYGKLVESEHCQCQGL